jgi:uncharacterized damage-inducible protein DinB
MTGPLIDVNTELLQQGGALLENLSPEQYARSPQRIGAHFRHVLEFYECLLNGLGRREVDYDRRARDAAVEKSRAVCLERLRRIACRLEACRNLDPDAAVRVRMEDGDLWLGSTVARELQAVASHTTHHYALIAIAARSLGVDPGETFGVARSTLRYLALQDR